MECRGTSLLNHASFLFGGSGSHRNCSGCSACLCQNAFGSSHQSHSLGHWHGAHGFGDELHQGRLARRTVFGIAWRLGRLFGGAHERTASAQRPSIDGRGTLDCGPKLQRANLYPDFGWRLRFVNGAGSRCL